MPPMTSWGVRTNFSRTPAEALAALERRATQLRQNIAELDRDLHDQSGPPRLFLLESEYLSAVATAELTWVSGVIDDLRNGNVTWSFEEIAELAQHFLPLE
jgi:hypothetical protein